MAAPQALSPSSSIYINNLPEKLQKQDLRRELYMLFSTYGPVIEVTAVKTVRMRGQAHILFRDVQAASQAMRECQGFPFFGRQMRITYAKTKSKKLIEMLGGVVDEIAAAATTAAQRSPVNVFPSPQAAGLHNLPTGLPANPNGRLPPPRGLPAPPQNLPPPNKLPVPPKANGGLAAPAPISVDAPSPQGVKRPRESESDEEALMEESDGEAEMDISDDSD